jgi:hypothetical protein
LSVKCVLFYVDISWVKYNLLSEKFVRNLIYYLYESMR